jgi:hypothetical protein
VNVTSEKTEGTQSRPSIKKSRSFMPIASPRIHISEPSTESYLESGDENISFDLEESVVQHGDTPQKEGNSNKAGEVPYEHSDVEASKTKLLYVSVLQHLCKQLS